jgi:hypothetical protein
MADLKISQLTAATTPLAGTEVVPLVQSSSTKKVAVSDLTAGRAVSAASLALTSSPLPATSGGTGQSSAFTANGIVYASSTSALATGSNVRYDGTAFIVSGKYITVSGGGLGYKVDGVTQIDRNQDFGYLLVGSTDVQIRFSTNSGVRQTIDTNGNIYGTSGTTSMTDGFFYIPAAGGAPSGTPTSVAGRVPMYYDTTNNKFYVYNGSWKSVALT